MRVTLVVALTGCVGGSPLDQPEPDFIRNGTDDAGDPAVVALRTPDGFPFCSGSLVAPSVVLTAGHCVAGRGPADLQVFFGANAFGAGRVEAVTEVASHPLFDPAVISEHDLAVLALGAPVTDVPPVTLNAAEPALGSAARLVGFGNSESGNGTHGTKRQGSTSLAQLDGNALVYDDSPSGICFGDSGGPTFGAGEAQIGVHWAVGGGDPLAGTCVPPNFDTRVDTHLDFVRAFIDAHGGIAPPPSPPPADPDPDPDPGPEGPCGLPSAGVCRGDILIYCDVDVGMAYEVDCREWGLTCGFRAESGQYDCD